MHRCITPLPCGRGRRTGRRPRRSPRRRSRRPRPYVFLPVLAGPAGEEHPQRARRPQGAARRPRPARRTARRWSTGRRCVAPAAGERLGRRRPRPPRRLVHGLDAARLEEVGGEGRPRGVRGGRARARPGRPRAGRRWPPGARRSGPAAPRTPRRGAPGAARRRGPAGRGLALDGRLGEMRELADPGDRFAAVGQVLRAALPRWPRAARRPARSAGPRPGRPRRSISWNHAQAAWASSSVSRSTYQEPPAGSITRARCDSSSRIGGGVAGDPAGEGVGQAERVRRRAARSPRPRRRRPAASAATVVRSMFTHGSRRVIITGEVTACWRCARGGRSAPHTSATRAHSRRAARSLAMVRNWSAVAA